MLKLISRDLGFGDADRHVAHCLRSVVYERNLGNDVNEISPKVGLEGPGRVMATGIRGGSFKLRYSHSHPSASKVSMTLLPVLCLVH
jgi:hypothetical protein